MNIFEEIETLTPLAEVLKRTKDLGEKQELLLTHPRVQNKLAHERLKPFFSHGSDLSIRIAFFALLAIDQDEHVLFYPEEKPPREKIQQLLHSLSSIEHFYESIGGIVGYQLTVLNKLAQKSEDQRETSFSRPDGIDLMQKNAYLREMILLGIQTLPEMGEIYPIGGLGSRLDLKGKKGESLPAARLQFCGRTLLEGLIRDLQAREFCYYKLFGKQMTTPIAIMTSQENQNCEKVKAICRRKNWFGRPKESFYIFSQLSVPVVDQNGKWAVQGPLQLHLQPGGHGALWRTAQEKGVFIWFQELEKHRLLVRQINNPIAGIDSTLLALCGIGTEENKAFGFASCQRLPHAAEGVLVSKEQGGKKSLSNIEYTDFKKFGIEDLPGHDGYSQYPANTNILYADLRRLMPLIRRNPLPGLVLNLKNKSFGRLESMMQSLSDSIVAPKNQELPSFLIYNERRRTISTTKRSFDPQKGLLETPEGAFYDLLYNGHELLKKYCNFSLFPFSSSKSYLEKGPSLVFLYHPALGPLYEVISQKLRGGRIAKGGELQLEIADLLIENLDLGGSLRIEAENLLGHRSQGIIRYSEKTGKCVLKNVKVRNRGINFNQTSCYWKNTFKRHQETKIILQGHSEFYAENVVLEGNQTFTVPDGERWILLEDGMLLKQKSGWIWNYRLEQNHVKVEVDLGSIFHTLS